MAKKTKKKKLNVKPIVTLAIIVIIFAGAFFFLNGEETNYYEFTACMTETGLIEMGCDC